MPRAARKSGSPIERVTAHLCAMQCRRHPGVLPAAERAQLHTDYAELRRRHLEILAAGYAVELSPYMISLGRLEGLVEVPSGPKPKDRDVQG